MIINGNVQAVAGAYSVSNTGSVKRAYNAQAVEKKDEVLLSHEGQSFSSMLQKLQSMDDVREDKVKDMSARLNAGSYEVSSENLAASLLNARF